MESNARTGQRIPNGAALAAYLAAGIGAFAMGFIVILNRGATVVSDTKFSDNSSRNIFQHGLSPDLAETARQRQNEVPEVPEADGAGEAVGEAVGEAAGDSVAGPAAPGPGARPADGSSRR